MFVTVDGNRALPALRRILFRRVTCRTGDRPFINLDDFISQEELRALSDRYKRIAGYSIESLGAPDPAPAQHDPLQESTGCGQSPAA